jgi:precorrin-3B synthase
VLVELAHAFLAARGTGPAAPWHVDELAAPLCRPEAAHPAAPPPSGPLPHGRVPGGDHVAAPDGVLEPALVARLVQAAGGCHLVVTPWHGVLVPEAVR